MNYYTKEPNITKETSSGMLCYSIQDDMLNHREIECIGEINSESVNSLIRQIRYLARQDPNGEITILINSPGGEVASGLALYDVMQSVDCPIKTVCVGTAASMAAVLFAAGDERVMLPNARVMIHDPLISSGIGGSTLTIKSISDDLMKTREIVAKILAKHTHKTLKEIYKKTEKDSYFYAEEAIEYGLADRIINKFTQERM